MTDVASLQMERDRLRAEVDGLKQAYSEATGRMSGLIGYAVKECESLRAELAEVRRLLLPHPDAKAGQDAGCACDLHTAVTAAAWSAAEMRRLRGEVAALRAGGDRVQHTGGVK